MTNDLVRGVPLKLELQYRFQQWVFPLQLKLITVATWNDQVVGERLSFQTVKNQEVLDASDLDQKRASNWLALGTTLSYLLKYSDEIMPKREYTGHAVEIYLPFLPINFRRCSMESTNDANAFDPMAPVMRYWRFELEELTAYKPESFCGDKLIELKYVQHCIKAIEALDNKFDKAIQATIFNGRNANAARLMDEGNIAASDLQGLRGVGVNIDALYMAQVNKQKDLIYNKVLSRSKGRKVNLEIKE